MDCGPTARRSAAHGVLRTLAAMLAALLLVSGCTGGGGGTGAEVPEVNDRDGPSAPPRCIWTRDHGCIPPSEFEARVTELAETYRDHPGFSDQWGLAAIRADEAYAHLELADGSTEPLRPGEGVVVGVIDSGIDEEHPLFEGTKLTEVLVDGTENETGERFSHGTAVASVIAGTRNPIYTNVPHGVAWGAELAVFAIPLGSAGPEPYEPILPSEIEETDAGFAALFRGLLDWRNDEGKRIDFLNLSFGFNGLVDLYSRSELRDSLGHTIAAMEQADSRDKTIFIWAAGNAHGDDCVSEAPWCVDGKVVADSVEVLAGLTAHFESLRGHSIAVVATGEDGAIAEFSNRCGIAAEWCLAAPGHRVRVAYFGPFDEDTPGFRGIATSSGTSLAAPMVTGGLAVMKHQFRNQLPNTDLVTRLFATANREGIYADRAFYGHGMMDLGAATSPVGASRFALGGRVGGAARPLSDTRLSLGGAVGDGFSRAFAGREIAAFDALGAPFWFELGDFASTPDGPSMAERLRDFMAPTPEPHTFGAPAIAFPGWPAGLEPGPSRAQPNPLQFGFLATPARTGSGHLSLAERASALSLVGSADLVLTAFSTLGMDRVEPALGGALRWRPPGAALGLRAGWLAEREAMLGTSAQGAFGRLTSHATFAGVESDTDIAGWRVAGATEVGVVNPSLDGGLLTEVSPLTTSTFAVSATRPLGDDGSFRLSVSQPLRVEDGRATLSLPVGREKRGDVVRDTLTVDLNPSGRQIDVEARWGRKGVAGGDLQLGAVWTRDPGHRADAKPGVTLLAGWNRTF